MASGINRRTFLKKTSATAAGAYIASVLPASADSSSERSLVAISTPLITFPYADVQLLDGPMKRQFDENHARFLNLDEDRMLKVFRQVAGLPAPGEDMGGWYDLTGFSLEGNDFHGFIAGHTLALAMRFAWQENCSPWTSPASGMHDGPVNAATLPLASTIATCRPSWCASAARSESSAVRAVYPLRMSSSPKGP